MPQFLVGVIAQTFLFIFCGSLVLVRWQAFMIFLVMKLVFYEPTVLKAHPPFCRITAYATMLGQFPLNLCFHALIQMNGAWKMVSTVGGLNPRPLNHESSALTTRPWLLVYVIAQTWHITKWPYPKKEYRFSFRPSHFFLQLWNSFLFQVATSPSINVSLT